MSLQCFRLVPGVGLSDLARSLPAALPVFAEHLVEKESGASRLLLPGVVKEDLGGLVGHEEQPILLGFMVRDDPHAVVVGTSGFFDHELPTWSDRVFKMLSPVVSRPARVLTASTTEVDCLEFFLGDDSERGLVHLFLSVRCWQDCASGAP